MIPICQTAVCLAIVISGAIEAASGAQSGYLSAYAEVPTVGTVAYRQEVGDIPQDLRPYDVLIAVADCSRIGKEATLYTAVGPLRALVIDCAGNDGTPSWMEENRIIAEIDYYSWQRWPELVGSAAVLVIEGE